MSDEVRDLYQEFILDHHKKPRNYGKLESANRESKGYNPLCGDRITIYLLVDDGKISKVAWEGSGCAICTASASVMSEILTGKDVDVAEDLFGKFHDLVTGDPCETPSTDGLGKLAVFFGVREFPVRVKCATLPWHTLKSALFDRKEQATTEEES